MSEAARRAARFAAAMMLAATAAQAGSPYAYVHHAAGTQVEAAQAAFDRGLTLIYAYNADEAQKSFRQAAQLDPGMPMAWWGIALSLGPDINTDPDPANTAKAAAAIERARQLEAQRPDALEREFIEALAPRYSAAANPDFDQLALAYRDSTHALAERHPEDADAVALYAEAAMDVHPWQLWSAAGEPAEGTAELVRVLEAGLRAHPGHLGLMHYEIHAVEASNEPGRALAAARSLAAQPMEPAAAHLVHMPAHTFLRVGDWQSAIHANEHAVHAAVDYRLSEDPAAHQACGHCLDFLVYAYSMAGNAAGALQAAQSAAHLMGDPVDRIVALARFHRGTELLALPEPSAEPKPKDEVDVHVVRAIWHYGRGIAGLDAGDRAAAARELAALRAEQGLAPPIPPPSAVPAVAKVTERIADAAYGSMLVLAGQVLEARIAAARGDRPGTIAALRAAVATQDGAQYTEPPIWLYPVRQSLAAALVAAGQRREAESVLRESLRRVPGDPRAQAALAGLLQQRGQRAEAMALRAQVAVAQPHADTPFLLE